jgi:hypothetical protein
MPTLDEWTATVCSTLRLDPSLVDQALILDLARDVAHGVHRTAAPLTAYMLGLAVGTGTAMSDGAAAIAALIPEPTSE